MSWLGALDVAGTGVTAAGVRMGVIAENLANSDTTRTEVGGPYRRRVVVLASSPLEGSAFRPPVGWRPGEGELVGVTVREIAEAPDPVKRVYEPGHPDADAQGYVAMPNVQVPLEMADLVVASRVYQANVTALQTLRRSLSESLNLLS